MNSPNLAALSPAPKSTAVVNGKTVDVFDPSWRISILAPTYDAKVTTLFFHSYLQCMQARAHYRMPDGSVAELPIIAGCIMPEGDSHVDRARNTAVNLWVEKNPHKTKLAYWWDVDIEVGPHHLLELYRLAMLGHRFVCGAYASKTIVPRFILAVQPGQTLDPAAATMKLFNGGTGSMMWHIDVPRSLQTHPLVKPFRTAPNHPCPGEKWWAYFHSGAEGPKAPPEATADQVTDWLSEDWQACRDWQQLGGEVIGAPQVKLRHGGQLVYPPDIKELVEATIEMLGQNHPAVDRPRLIKALGLSPGAPRTGTNLAEGSAKADQTETKPLAA